jgi:hypothetical protein
LLHEEWGDTIICSKRGTILPTRTLYKAAVFNPKFHTETQNPLKAKAILTKKKLELGVSYASSQITLQTHCNKKQHGTSAETETYTNGVEEKTQKSAHTATNKGVKNISWRNDAGKTECPHVKD